MTPEPSVVVTLNLDPGTAEIRLRLGGTAAVKLRAVVVAGKDVTGRIEFDATAAVVENRVEDSFEYVPLGPHVLRAAEKFARMCLQRAREHTERVLVAHRRVVPGTP